MFVAAVPQLRKGLAVRVNVLIHYEVQIVERHADERFYYITYETKIRDMPPFKNYDVPHWVVELDEPAGAFLTRYSMAGGPHHLAAVPGHRTSSSLSPWTAQRTILCRSRPIRP